MTKEDPISTDTECANNERDRRTERRGEESCRGD